MPFKKISALIRKLVYDVYGFQLFFSFEVGLLILSALTIR